MIISGIISRIAGHIYVLAEGLDNSLDESQPDDTKNGMSSSTNVRELKYSKKGVDIKNIRRLDIIHLVEEVKHSNNLRLSSNNISPESIGLSESNLRLKSRIYLRSTNLTTESRTNERARRISQYKIIRNDSYESVLSYIEACTMFSMNVESMYSSILDYYGCSHDELVRMMDNISELRIMYGEDNTSNHYNEMLSSTHENQILTSGYSKDSFDCFRFLKVRTWHYLRIKRILVINGITLDKLNNTVMNLSDFTEHMIDHFIPYLDENLNIYNRKLSKISEFVLKKSISSRKLYIISKDDRISEYSPNELYRHWLVFVNHPLAEFNIKNTKDNEFNIKNILQPNRMFTQNDLESVGDNNILPKHSKHPSYVQDYELRMFSLDNFISYQKLFKFISSSRYDNSNPLNSPWLRSIQHLLKDEEWLKNRQLSDSQINVVEGCLKNSRSIIFGQAGTGKTYTLLHILNILKNLGNNILVLSFSGKAVASLKRKYVEMFGSYENEETKDENGRIKYGMIRFMTGHMSLFAGHQNVDVLIVEEISIFPIKLFVRILDFFNLHHDKDTNRNSSYFPRIIFVGDSRQLKSLNDLSVCEYLMSDEYNPKCSDKYNPKCSEKYNPKCSENTSGKNLSKIENTSGKNEDITQNRIIPTFILSDVMRNALNVTKMSKIISLLTKNRKLLKELTLKSKGYKLSESKDVDRLYKYLSGESMNVVYLSDQGTSPKNLKNVEDLYKDSIVKYGIQNVKIITPYKKFSSAINIHICNEIHKDNENNTGNESGMKNSMYLRSISRNDSSLTEEYQTVSEKCLGSAYSVGDLIIITENDYKFKLFNGQEGFIKSESNNLSVVEFDNQTISLTNKYLAEHSCLAYCITVHKSQGDEWNRIIFFIPHDNINPLITDELIYTAISRVKKSITVLI